MNAEQHDEHDEERSGPSAKERLELTARMVVPALLQREEFHAEDIIDGLDAAGGFGKRALWKAMEITAEEHGVRFVPKKGGGYTRAGPERRLKRVKTRLRAATRNMKRQKGETERLIKDIGQAAEDLHAKIDELLVRTRARTRLESKKKPKGL
jgi:transcriptional accessory protein Tex/SPT6